MSSGLGILYQDEYLVVIDKPAGMLSIPDRFDREIENLHDLLTGRFGKVHPVHRLDRETSGVIAFARTPEANFHLSRQFERHEVEKSYLALVRGCPAEAEGLIDVPIGDHPARRGLMRIDSRHGKPAQTRWRVVERLGGFGLLEMRPLTGRQHQIRIHLQYLGFPLAVDPVYGGAASLSLSDFKIGFKRKQQGGERPLVERLTLHAHRLRFVHPVRLEAMEIVSEIPKDLAVALKQLRRWGKPEAKV